MSTASVLGVVWVIHMLWQESAMKYFIWGKRMTVGSMIVSELSVVDGHCGLGISITVAVTVVLDESVHIVVLILVLVLLVVVIVF
jgi:hypothetical protein